MRSAFLFADVGTAVLRACLFPHVSLPNAPPPLQLHQRYIRFCESRLKMKRRRIASLSVFSDLLMRLEEGSLIKITGQHKRRKVLHMFSVMSRVLMCLPTVCVCVCVCVQSQRSNLVVHAEVSLQDVAFAVKDLRECHLLLTRSQQAPPPAAKTAARAQERDNDAGMFPTRTDEAFLPDHDYL